MKYGLMEALPELMASPSPRRAWIEIRQRRLKSVDTTVVALPTEGVD